MKKEGSTMDDVRIAMNGANSMNCDFEREIAIVGELGFDYIELRDWAL
jgi:hypothetical protein